MTRQAPPRALVVEHDGPTRLVLGFALEALGFAPIAVASGDEALDTIAHEVLAFAVVESRLPGALSGLELLEALRIEIPSLPVLVLVETERPADVLSAFHAGAADVLLKPFEPADLRHGLARALAARPAEAALDFQGRIELGKTALAGGAMQVAREHLRAALRIDPLDAEAMNLYGLVAELAGDSANAAQAYRAAFALAPDNTEARQNLDRTDAQLGYIGWLDRQSLEEPELSGLRVAIPVFEPDRDLALLGIAKALVGPAGLLAIGYAVEPPSADVGRTQVVAQRRGFVRATGRLDGDSTPCRVDYLFALDRLSFAQTLASQEKCELSLIGQWAPESLRSKLAESHRLVTTERSDFTQVAAVAAELKSAGAALRLAVAVQLSRKLRRPLELPAAVRGLPESANGTVPVALLFATLGLCRPAWCDGAAYVGFRTVADGGELLRVDPSSLGGIDLEVSAPA